MHLLNGHKIIHVVCLFHSEEKFLDLEEDVTMLTTSLCLEI